jgi:hypothetical protein
MVTRAGAGWCASPRAILRRHSSDYKGFSVLWRVRFHHNQSPLPSRRESTGVGGMMSIEVGVDVGAAKAHSGDGYSHLLLT